MSASKTASGKKREKRVDRVTGGARDERFTARLPRAEKALLQRAAERRGLSLSAYVFGKARHAAIAELEEAGEIILAPTEQRRFVDLLLDAPPPTLHLLRALQAAEPIVRRR